MHARCTRSTARARLPVRDQPGWNLAAVTVGMLEAGVKIEAEAIEWAADGGEVPPQEYGGRVR